MAENIKYNYEVLGKKVAVQFKVGKKGTSRPYVGIIRRVQISMEEEDESTHKFEVLHEVVFNDGEEHWLDLEEVEDQGRLEWRDQEVKREKDKEEVSEEEEEVAKTSSDEETTSTPKEDSKETDSGKSSKKLGQPIRVSLNKAKLARKALLKSLVAAAGNGSAVVTPAQQPKKKKRKRDSLSSVASSKGGDLEWVEDMYTWMVKIGNDGRGSTPKSALRIRKEVLKLATGEGITHKQWSSRGIKNFYAGIKVDLDHDMDELLHQSQIFQDKYGKDPSHGWLMQGPIGKLKAYQEYVRGQE